MTTANSALPLPTKEYSIEYMNRLVKQLNLALNKLNAVGPLTVGSDLSSQVAAHPVSGLTIIDIPTSPSDLPVGSVWSDAGVLKIVS